MARRFMLLMGMTLMTESVCAQTATPVCGGSDRNDAGSMSYTIGQVDYLYSKSSAGNAVAGVQQPFDDHTAYRSSCDGVEMVITPNPTVMDVYVVCDVLDAHYHYVLTELSGKILFEGNLEGEYTTIATSHLIAGTYLLNIYCGDGDSDKSVFKIIKL